MRSDCVLFDLDGTLVDTYPGIAASIRYSLEKMGWGEISQEQLKKFIGPPLLWGYENVCAMDSQQAEQAVALYREKYRSGGMFECQIYPGIQQLLGALKEKKVRLCVATSKPREFAVAILQKLGLLDYFDYVSAVDFDHCDMEKKELITRAMAQCGKKSGDGAVMVGDRKYDIDGAHQAGIPCIAVEYGFGNKEEFLRHGADAVAADARELAQLLGVEKA